MLTQNRREFLGTAGALVIGLTLPLRGVRAAEDAGAGTPFAPNAFVRIAADDTVTLICKHIEFGQGPMTGLATLVAEELDADWAQMRAESAPANDELYANLFLGVQGTGGSNAIANSWEQMRRAGATARAMLVAAAAGRWDVSAGDIDVSAGVVRHGASGRSASFGELAADAALQTAPEDPPLKSADQFVLIGRSLPKLDTPGKVDGSAQFALDLYREGMETVVIARPTIIGATVAGVDASKALEVDGVTAVRELPMGVAVYAQSTAAALKGRKALAIDWNLDGAETRSSDEILDGYAASAQEQGLTVEERGDSAGALAGAVTVHEAEFRFPFLAHAPMEPLNGVIELRDGRAEIWSGAQFPGGDKQVAAQALGLPPERVTLNVTLAGGSFGRRAQTTPQIGSELGAIAAAAGRDGAWKLLWTREDDITGAYYRPPAVHRLRGGLDGDGNIVGWENTVATPSIILGTFIDSGNMDGKDPTAFEGSTALPYALEDLRVAWVRTETTVPVLWWRSVGHTHTAYATEVFLDELLEQGGRDPVQGRLALLKPDAARHRGVLETVAGLAGWDGQRVKGDRGYGVALHKSFGSYVAMIAEVTAENDFPRVQRVWAAVDCGVAVNPNVIEAQVEGAVGYALCAALFDEITLAPGGEVQQSNFDRYRMLRIDEMPEVKVAIVPSAEAPSGIGEPGTPPTAPAVANAWRALTGKRVTRLPFTRA